MMLNRTGLGCPSWHRSRPLAVLFVYLNGISVDTESEISLIAVDCVCYREIKTEEDTLKLQRYVDRLGSWAWV